MATIRPTRRISALLGFLLKAEVDAIFKQQPFEPADPTADPAILWRASCQGTQSVASMPPGSIEPIDEHHPAVVAIKSRRTYHDHYEAVADYHFGLAPIEALLTPQCFADLDYIDELAAMIPPGKSLGEQLGFAMPETTIAEPIVAGNQIFFSSPRRDLHADPIPRVRETNPGEFEISVRATSRPNYIQVAVMRDRLFLVNGVHKVCALHKHGLTRVPCIYRSASRLEEAGFNPLLTSLFRPDLFDGPRPARVLDFLNNNIAVPLKIRSMYQVLRIVVIVEPFTIPSVLGAEAAITQKPELRDTQAAPQPIEENSRLGVLPGQVGRLPAAELGVAIGTGANELQLSAMKMPPVNRHDGR